MIHVVVGVDGLVGRGHAGDAHGFWTSSQGIAKNNVWLNPTHNVGDSLNPAHPNSGQYWDRNGSGVESLNTAAAQQFGVRTGIAVKNDEAPKPFPVVGNGSYANFAGFYNSNAPVSTKRANLTIYEQGTLAPLVLANGNNNAIIGATANADGFPTQFVWNGTALRPDSSTYNGQLIFAEDFLLYVDGNITISSAFGGQSLNIIASGDITINTNTVPATNLSLIAFDILSISTNTVLHGIYYAGNTLNISSNPQIFGGLIAKNFNYTGGNTQITYVDDYALAIGKWLPESATPTVNLISWKEVAP